MLKSDEICVILGNGLSLSEVPNDLLEKFYTFGTNGIYRKMIPDFYVCINRLEAKRREEEIKKLTSRKFLTDYLDIPCEFYLHSNGEAGTFSFSPDKWICEGSTVTYVCLQLAYFMKFKTVFLLGVDHRYIYEGTPNEQIVWKGKDVNHFDENYISSGDKWNSPDLMSSEVHYKIAYSIFKTAGREIINLTKNSHLDIFPKMSIDVLYSMI